MHQKPSIVGQGLSSHRVSFFFPYSNASRRLDLQVSNGESHSGWHASLTLRAVERRGLSGHERAQAENRRWTLEDGHSKAESGRL